MSMTYKARLGWRRFFTGLLIFGIIMTVVLICWFLWLGRYVVYYRDHAAFDFNLSKDFPSGQDAPETVQKNPVKIVINELDPEDGTVVYEQTSIRGYYLTIEELKADFAGVREQLDKLPAGTAIMLDMKNIRGQFHYTTTNGPMAADIDIEAVDAFMEYLAQSNLYTIARIPAFRDRDYGLNNVPCGLPIKGGGGALWIDSASCYWLDPTNDQVIGHLIQIATELRNLGFDEVVFDEFRFPDTNRIVFDKDKTQAITDAAKMLVDACASDRFCISFIGTNADFPLPQGHARLYLSGVNAADIETTAEKVQTDDPSIHLLFLTDVYDTRFDKYSVLRPLNTAH